MIPGLAGIGGLQASAAAPAASLPSAAWWRLRVTADNGSFGGGNHFANLDDITFYDKNLAVIPTTGGTAISSGYFSTDSAANAFDSNSGTHCSLNTNGLYSGPTTVYIGYHFTADVEPVYVRVASSGGSNITAWVWEYSSDGSSWTSAGAVTGYSFTGIELAHHTIQPATESGTTAHADWRVVVTRCQTTQQPSVATLELRATAGGSTITTGGTARSSTMNGGFPIANAYDGNSATFALSSGGFPWWFGYTPASSSDVPQIYVVNRNDGFGVNESWKDFAVQYSDDGRVTWVTKWSIWNEAAWSAGEARTYTR